MFDYSIKFLAIDKISEKINKINAKMESMRKKASQTSNSIKNTLGEMRITSEFKIRTQEALDKIKYLKNRIKEIRDDLQHIGMKAGAVGAAFLYGINRTVEAYQEVERAKGEIASLGIDAKGVKAITDEAIRFSNAWAGTSVADFIKASYDIKSGIASLSDVDVGKFTAIAGLTAQATKSTTEEMTKLFALGYGIYRKQFNSDIEFGEKFSSAIASAVQAFRTDGGDLINGLSTLGSTATAMGVSLEEQLSILGVSKSAFNTASEAATSYRAIINGVVNAQKKYGIKTLDANNKMLPMVDILENIKAKAKELGVGIEDAKFQDMLRSAFGSIEAVKMISALIGKTDELRKAQNNLSNGMKKGIKVTEKMAKAMQQGKEYELLSQQVENASASIGRVFAPVALTMAKIFGKISISIQKFISENPKLAKVIGYTIAILSGLAVVAGIVAIAMFAISLPVLLVIAAVTAVTMAFVALYVYWDDIVNFINEVFTTAIMKVHNAIEWVSDGVKDLISWFGEIITWIGKLWNKFTGFIGSLSLVKNAIRDVKIFFNMLISPIKRILDLIDKFLSKFSIYNKAKEKIKDVAHSIETKAKSAWNNVKDFFGFGNETKDSKINNATKNVVSGEIVLRAEPGTQVVYSKQKGTNIKLPTVSNGVQ